MQTVFDEECMITITTSGATPKAQRPAAPAAPEQQATATQQKTAKFPGCALSLLAAGIAIKLITLLLAWMV